MVVKKNAQQGELKGMTAKLAELGIIDGDLIKVERGIPHEEETFEIRACLVKLVGGTSPTDTETNDEVIFTKKQLCSFRVSPATTTVQQIKNSVLEEYNKISEIKINAEQLRLRIPRFEDFGDVLEETENLENLDLFDGKELYV